MVSTLPVLRISKRALNGMYTMRIFSGSIYNYLYPIYIILYKNLSFIRSHWIEIPTIFKNKFRLDRAVEKLGVSLSLFIAVTHCHLKCIENATKFISHRELNKSALSIGRQFMSFSGDEKLVWSSYDAHICRTGWCSCFSD